jgi:hypothetical protein
MNLIIRIFTAKGTWVVVPIVGLLVAAQNCDQGLAAAAFALSILGILPGILPQPGG